MGDDYSRFTGKTDAPPAPATSSDDAELITAIKSGAEANVRAFLKKGASANAREEKTGHSALTLAINKGNPPEVEALIAAGADVNERDSKNRTRFEHAVDKYMVARFVRTSLTDKHAAVYAKKIVALVASAPGFSPIAKTSYGTDSAAYARKAGLSELADMLTQKAERAQQGIAGRTGTVE